MRKNLPKILITISCILLVVVASIIYKKINNSNTSKADGSITIEIIDINGKSTKNVIDYKVGDTVWSIIKNNYVVRYEDGLYGVVLYDIEDIKTDFVSEYIAIYVNDAYSTQSISNIAISDGMKITLKELKI